MTDTLAEISGQPVKERFYHSPRGLYSFQAEFVAHCYLRHSKLVVADTGLGKTHIALATAAMLFEDDKIDLVVFVVEGNKLVEWAADLKEFTCFSFGVFHGGKRDRILRNPLPQAIVTTYHTGRDAFSVKRTDTSGLTDGPLATTILMSGARVLMVYDEVALVGTSRTSGVYESHYRFANQLRRVGRFRGIGLSATPMTSSPENYFNITRILDPALAGSVDDFYRDHVAGWNQWAKPNRWKNLDPEDTDNDPAVTPLGTKLMPLILRKRKTDADVIDKFPKQVERFVPVNLSDDHISAYRSLDEYIEMLAETVPESRLRFAFNSLLAFACHPRTALESGSEAVQDWATSFGAGRIAKIKSAKVETTIAYIREILSQGGSDGIIVFAFHTSVLRCLSDDLAKAKIEHVRYDGDLTQPQRDRSKATFKSGAVRVMLASSAAERGVNLPEASYIINFDVPVLHSSYLQRLSRGSRIDAKVGGTLVVKTLIAQGTIEHAAVRMWNRRNDWSDQVQDHDGLADEEFVSALDRLVLLRRASREGEPT